MEKVCLLCGKKFKTDKRHSYQNYCSHYCNKKHYREKHREEIKEKKARDFLLIKKNPEKLKALRERTRISEIRYRKKHRDLINSRGRTRYQSPKGIIYYKEYYKKNKPRFSLNAKQYNKNNRDKINKRYRKYNNQKYNEDKNYNIKKRLRGSLRKKFNRYVETGKTKPAKYYEVDYEAIINFLKPLPKNQKDYQIHHIKELSSFSFTNKDGSPNLEEIKKAFAPENHQLLTIEKHRKTKNYGKHN